MTKGNRKNSQTLGRFFSGEKTGSDDYWAMAAAAPKG